MAIRTETRQKILDAAAQLLANEGRESVTTRSVSAAAGVQPPTIYRLFGDMKGLLDAVAADGFAQYLARKTAQYPSGDPVDDLRAGWDMHVEFGLANPAHYLLMYGEPSPGSTSDTASAAHDILLGLVRRIAEAGRLVVSVGQAAGMVHAAGMGVTLSLIGVVPAERDTGLSTRTREAVVSAITADAPENDERENDERETARRAIALRALLDGTDYTVEFTAGERVMLDELLGRLAGEEVSRLV